MAKSFSSRAPRRELPPTAGSRTVSALGGRAGASVEQSITARSDKTSPRRLTAGVLMASEDILWHAVPIGIGLRRRRCGQPFRRASPMDLVELGLELVELGETGRSRHRKVGSRDRFR